MLRIYYEKKIYERGGRGSGLSSLVEVVKKLEMTRLVSIGA
jgi:hypothetical protein